MFPYELEVMDVVFIFFCEIWARFNVEQGFVQGIHGQNDVQDTKWDTEKWEPWDLSFSYHYVLIDHISELWKNKKKNWVCFKDIFKHIFS